MRLRWEQHLDLLPLPAGGLIVLGLGDVASHVPGALVDRSWDLPGRLLRAALLLEGAGVAVVLAGAIAKLTAVTDDPGRHQGLAGRTAVGRSEEHTSELQSLMRISYAVFCLNKNNDKL